MSVGGSLEATRELCENLDNLVELAHASLSRDFRHINPHTAHILLVEAGPRVLSGFPERLAVFSVPATPLVGHVIHYGRALGTLRMARRRLMLGESFRRDDNQGHSGPRIDLVI